MKQKSFGILILTLLFLSVNVKIYSQGIGLVDIKYADKIITVGGAEADIPAFTSNAIQIALDAIKTRGGGTVKLNPGVFDITGPVRIPDNSALIGSGKTTILRKCDGFRTSYTIDADYGMQKANVKDASGFRVGMGIQLYDNEHNQGWDVTTAKITDIKDNVIYFDN
jgi:hypothetical protein